ncbi:MAG: FAD-dependent oxidoreductase [Porphyromonadaceae bacterium]|nr:FAD-dependent oxidoreductase [Porphyromonadaceae bacterium]
MSKYLIVGGVAGGATAAARMRRLDEHAEIILVESGKHISYANCGLPYYIGGSIKDRSKLFVQTPESFGQRFNLEVRTQQTVTAVYPDEHTVEIQRADGSIYRESYDKLLLSPGASPIVPNIEGADLPGVFTLRNVEDIDRIKAFVDEQKPRRAVIVGGGFIGLEMAENLYEQGMEVSVVELAPQVMAPIDFSMASLVHAHLRERGVGLYLGQGLEQISSSGRGGLSLRLSTGELLQTDMLLLSIGVRPRTELAAHAGIALGDRGGIKVDEYFRTSAEDIYAVGDAIEYPHPITGQPWLNYLAGPANRQARLVADAMVTCSSEPYEGAIGTSIAKVFDITVAATGLPAKALKQSSLPYQSVTIHPFSHATYYPGAHQLTLKLTFHPETGRIYGAQAVGIEGIDKRIDSIAQLIKNSGTIADLVKTEQAYAPPFSSAKDPIALAGYVASNIISGRVKPIYWRDLDPENLGEATLVDVRTPAEYQLGHIPGAINLPVDDLRGLLDRLDPARPVYVYCAVGLRGYLASNILRQRGFADVRNLVGGFKLWSAATAQYNAPARPRQEAESSSTGASAQSRDSHVRMEIDARGLCCPGPIVTLAKAIQEVEAGTRLRVVATDPGFVRDAEAWCQTTGNKFVQGGGDRGDYSVTIEKADRTASSDAPCSVGTQPQGKTFILFSDDLDKALAMFVLANGAAATGEKVTIFFTFWGLNAVKRGGIVPPKKDIWGKMFGFMLPKDSTGLALSKMNMGGLGSWMMRRVMRAKGVDSLESLRDQAIAAGVEFIACQMSMDVMGISKEELLPEVTIGGVATYMQRANQANLNLFI